MFSLNATPNQITPSQTSNIRGNGGTPPYSITASGLGSFNQADTEGGIYTPLNIPNTYVVIFWAKDSLGSLARCDLRVN